MDRNFYKQNFFIKLYVADVDPKKLSKHKQQIRNKIILENNILKECYAKYKTPLNNVWCSKYDANHLFPTYMKTLVDADKFKSEAKKEINLLQAIEFLGLGWIPTDEYGELYQDDRERYYQIDPYSEKGQDQITRLEKGIKRLQYLLVRGLTIKLKDEQQQKNTVVEPNIILGADKTYATITCVEPELKSYKDAVIDFYNLKLAFEKARNLECGDTYQISMGAHGLFLQKNNGFKKEIHHFSWKQGKHMPDNQQVLQYVMLRENTDISIEEIHRVGFLSGMNFGNGLKSIFRKNAMMRKIQQYFFPGATKTIRFCSTVCNINEPEFEKFE